MLRNLMTMRRNHKFSNDSYCLFMTIKSFFIHEQTATLLRNPHIWSTLGRKSQIFKCFILFPSDFNIRQNLQKLPKWWETNHIWSQCLKFTDFQMFHWTLRRWDLRRAKNHKLRWATLSSEPGCLPLCRQIPSKAEKDRNYLLVYMHYLCICTQQ